MIEEKIDQQILNMSYAVDNYLIWRGNQPRKRNYFNYYPSGIGKCLRKQQYERFVFHGLIKAPMDEIDGRKQRIFDTGDSMHERWVKYFDDMGILRGSWKCANNLCKLFNDNGEFDGHDVNKIKNLTESKISDVDTRVYGTDNPIGVFKPKKCTCGSVDFIYQECVAEDPSIKYRGRMDAILDFSYFDNYFINDLTYNLSLDKLPKPGEIIIVDMKSCKDSVFVRNVQNGSGHPEYWAQLVSYLHVIEQSKYGILVYENKDTSKTKWIKVPKNDEMWATIRWQLEQLNNAIKTDTSGKVISSALPPPKPDKKSSFECKYCKFKGICHASDVWKDKNLDQKRKIFYKNV